MAAISFKAFDEKVEEKTEWLKRELLGIQTGRATAAVLDGIKVDVYGAPSPIEQIASVATEDARTLRIVPWDKNLLKPIETALRDADLGLGVAADEKGVRVSFPELTTESREKYVRIVKQKLEDARISIRQERDVLWKEIQDKEQAGEVTEDDKFRLKDEMEERVKKGNEALDELAERKEKEILGR